MKLTKWVATLALAFGGLAMAFADEMYFTHFENMSTGPISGQDGWWFVTPGGAANVQSTITFQGVQALQLSGNASGFRKFSYSGGGFDTSTAILLGPLWGRGVPPSTNTANAFLGQSFLVHDLKQIPYEIRVGFVRANGSDYGKIRAGSSGMFLEILSGNNLLEWSYVEINLDKFAGQWHQLALVVDEGVALLTVDGTRMGKVPLPFSFAGADSMRLYNTDTFTKELKRGVFIDDLTFCVEP